MILLTAMSTMGIGLLTLSLTQDNTRAEESINTNTHDEYRMIEDSEDKAGYLSMSSLDQEEVIELQPTAAPTPTPTPMPTPTPIPVYAIEETTDANIVNLFQEFFSAKKTINIDKLQSMMSDPANMDSQDNLINETDFIDDYRNIECYVKRGFRAGSYIAYVYHDMKITGINTPAPSLAKFYLITDEEGILKIFSGEMDAVLEEYYNARNEDEDVKELRRMTDAKFEEAKSKDEDLFNFCTVLEEISTENNGNTDENEVLEDNNDTTDIGITAGNTETEE